MKIRPGIELANLTDVGCTRTENQDYYAYAEAESDKEFRRKGRLAVVADGMGGHQGGQVASTIAVEAIRDTYLQDEGEDPEAALIAAFSGAQAAILQLASEHPELTGMGTTCVAVAIRDGRLHYGHVGDSRLYLFRNSTICRLTRDHTYVNRLVDEGTITPEQAETHPDRNVLTAALGMNRAVPAEFGESTLEASDVLLLCTDGLHGLVSDAEMLATTTRGSPSDACRELVALAKARGGFDNITLQIIRIDNGGEERQGSSHNRAEG
ncbi:MAG TPA: Stp1/IreP family PP2C-type Ser/Thr phosphatase [Terriglobia bacterium]|nr:Stp1/IreP family PP2C-type Ser/Thr phosphatase [Terriglobia bacterium]